MEEEMWKTFCSQDSLMNSPGWITLPTHPAVPLRYARGLVFLDRLGAGLAKLGVYITPLYF